MHILPPSLVPRTSNLQSIPLREEQKVDNYVIFYPLTLLPQFGQKVSEGWTSNSQKGHLFRAAVGAEGSATRLYISSYSSLLISPLAYRIFNISSGSAVAGGDGGVGGGGGGVSGVGVVGIGVTLRYSFTCGFLR